MINHKAILALALGASAVGLGYRIRADLRALPRAEWLAAAPSIRYVPDMEGYDANGARMTLPPVLRTIVLMPLHSVDNGVQSRIWAEFFGGAGQGKGILVIGVVPNGASGVGGLVNASWFRSVAYANYVPMLFVADLDRRNEIGILDNRGVVRKRIPRPSSVGELRAALL